MTCLLPRFEHLLGLPFGEPWHCGTLVLECLRLLGTPAGGADPCAGEDRLPEEIAAACDPVTDVTRPGDVLLFRIRNRWDPGVEQNHVAILVDSEHRFLHVMHGRRVELHSLSSAFWSRHLVGTFRPRSALHGR